AARAGSIPVEVTYFRPLEDQAMHEEKGSYLTNNGILKKVDDLSRMLILNDDKRIPIDDIISISSPVFDPLIPD
nr:hypothetical protein [Lachnospiraceae bacterium]